MNSPALRLILAAVAGLLSACSSPQICTRDFGKSDPAAKALLIASQDAHGKKAFAKVRDVSVRYEGKWAAVGPKFQPVLADTKFRRGSEERLLIASRAMMQEHAGPGGKKVVVHKPGTVAVAYNAVASNDAEASRAAALVADAYALFLLGPFYFDRPGVVLAPNGEGIVDKAMCDQVLAVLRPGFGMAKEDRVILFIDRTTKQLRRVRMTLSGLASTRGAEVDVTFRDFRNIGGIVWPTDFDERIRVPFNLHAHHWRMLGLDLNRGLNASDLAVTGFKGRAANPAAALPAR